MQNSKRPSQWPLKVIAITVCVMAADSFMQSAGVYQLDNIDNLVATLTMITIMGIAMAEMARRR